MRINVEMPLHDGACEPDVQRTLAGAIEEAGFGTLTLTDHPSPSLKWLRAGGHSTFDPFAGLTFYAAVTRRVRLMTHLAVVPYRNPLLMAKSIATVDRLSGGRFTLIAGTGYLRSEFLALGRSFETAQVSASVTRTAELERIGVTDTLVGAPDHRDLGAACATIAEYGDKIVANC